MIQRPVPLLAAGYPQSGSQQCLLFLHLAAAA
jgi:hypothetical protein